MTPYDAGDVVVVPFPFSDRDAAKRRPALVCSGAEFNNRAKHLVLAMITTAALSARDRATCQQRQPMAL